MLQEVANWQFFCIRLHVLEKRITTLCRKGVYSSLYSKQKMRIYAEKVNGDGNKARCSSEKAH